MALLKPKTVLVAIDESEHSMHALQWALDTLVIPCRDDLPGDKVILLHTKVPATSSVAFAGPAIILDADVIIMIEKSQDRAISKVMATAKQLCDEKNVIAETMVVTGDARDKICEVAENLKVDYLVLGSHGYGAVKRVVLGSVSDYCAHHAKCPVVIVKKPHTTSASTKEHKEDKCSTGEFSPLVDSKTC